MWQARVYVTLRPGILDPQGKATASGLQSLGYTGVQSVRVGKVIDVTLEAGGEAEAAEQVESMCERLLANPVIEAYTFEIRAAAGVEAEA